MNDDNCPLCNHDHDGLCPTSERPAAAPDTRPRIPYVLPDGTLGMIIFDHGSRVPDTISFAQRGGKVVNIPLSPTYTGPRQLPL